MNVSVCIPTLNEEENITTCLDNLIPQMREGDEVIVVDGGSSDMTQEIASEYGCRVFVAEGSSIGMARNIGVDKSSNPVIATIDADSIPPGGWLDRIKRHFSNNEDLSVLWGSIEDVNGVPIRNLVGKFSTVLGGASGNNTAFRKSKFEELEDKYPDISFMEDVAIIHRLSKVGKAKRDKNMVMVMNMDRRRYQTLPMIGLGISSFLLGDKLGGKIGRMSKGAGLGLVGTEMTYEKMSDSPIHHDMVGSLLASAGSMMDDSLSDDLVGAGFGVVAHHDMTEGLSLIPSQLQRNTNEVEG